MKDILAKFIKPISATYIFSLIFSEIDMSFDSGEKFPAKFKRTGYRRNFYFNGSWRGKKYNTKQVEVYTVSEGNDLIVLAVIVKYF